MENPFKVSGFVDDPAFCDREQEQKDLRLYIKNSQNILLFSPRRYGKSSLIKKVFKNLKNIRSVYVDLYGTTSIEEFLSACIKGISTVESQMERLMKLLREGIKSIGISFSVDPFSGLPTASPVFSRSVESRTFDELFSLLDSLSQKKKMVVAFDEFQEVSGYAGIPFEKLLRKGIQGHNRISYIFSGSQKHILNDMFNDRKRAFFKQAISYPLNKIKTGNYVKWIQGLYQQANRDIDSSLIEYIVERCENHPMYVQEYFFNLWSKDRLSYEVIDRTERIIIEKKVPEYSYLWDSLTLNQRKALKLVAGTAGDNIFSAHNLSKYGFRTASQATAALNKLWKTGIIDKIKAWYIHDPLFKRWLIQ